MSRPEAKIQLLHALGYLYCRHGQVKRALVLLLLAGRLAPRDEGVLKTLAYAFICDGAGQSALRVLDHLDTLGGGDRKVALLRSRALWLTGKEAEARECFRAFADERAAHVDAD